MTARKITIGLVQTTAGPDKQENIERTSALIRDAAKRGARLVCLQELFASPYFCQEENTAFFELAEPLDGPTVQAMAQVAKACAVSVVVPIFERRAAGLYHNSLAVVGPDGDTLGVYRKMHIPDDPLFFEKFYFTPGDLGFRSFDTKFGRIATLVCWDQ
ncbi:MAG TPA: nitrilase-related carbon-nitrogen hydrolase, partial [Polyangiaceae bacterium]